MKFIWVLCLGWMLFCFGLCMITKKQHHKVYHGPTVVIELPAPAIERPPVF